MPNQEVIEQQLRILATYRDTLAHYRLQQARLGADFAPPGVTHGIRDARFEIARIKRVLRDAGVVVEDHPDDDEVAASQQPSIPANTTNMPKTTSREASQSGSTFHFYGSIHSGVANFGGEQTVGNVSVNLGERAGSPDAASLQKTQVVQLDQVAQQIRALAHIDQAAGRELSASIQHLWELLEQLSTKYPADVEKVVKRVTALAKQIQTSAPDRSLVEYYSESLKRAASDVAVAQPEIQQVVSQIAKLFTNLVAP